MLRLLADRKVHRATFRWSIVQQFVFVAMILVIAAFVFWFAVAMLMPLADMVLNLLRWRTAHEHRASTGGFTLLEIAVCRRDACGAFIDSGRVVCRRPAACPSPRMNSPSR